MAPPIYAYITPEDLEDLGVNPAAISGIPRDKKLIAIDAACRFADTFLASQYTLPFTQVGRDLGRIIADIATYDMLSGRGYNPEGTDVNFRLRYEDAIAWLRRVANGEAQAAVIDSSGGGLRSSTADAAVISSESRGISTRGLSSPGTGYYRST